MSDTGHAGPNPGGNADRNMDADAVMHERIQTFIESMDSGSTAFLQKLEREALAEGVPVIRTQTQSLLKFFLELKKPLKILEIGTGTGFSAAFMATFAPMAHITTIEKDPRRHQKAQRILAAWSEDGGADVQGGHFTLLEGDALECVPKLEEQYDFIFLDAAKGQYIHLLPHLKRCMKPGALLISDNIFKEGEILASRFAVPRRDRTIHARMRSFLLALTQDDQLRTILLQEGDGTAVSIFRSGTGQQVRI